MSVPTEAPDHQTLFQATVTAEPGVLAQCDPLDLDLLPSRSLLADGRASIKAILRLDQLVYLVGAGATVLLERLIEPRFPPERILSSTEARARVEVLRRASQPPGD